MYTYSLFGLGVHSEIRLAGLPCQEAEPDVVITEVDEAEWKRLHTAALERQGGAAIVAQFYKSLYYLAEDGERVWVYRAKEMPEDLVEQCLVGQPLAVVLRQRGHLVLHACSVARGGKAVGFVGGSGVGKSTLAEACRQRGYQVLGDDILAIRLEPEALYALPAAPFIRIREGTGQALVEEYESLAPTWSASDQRLRTLDEERAEAELAGIYLLDADDHPTTEIRSVPEQEALVSLFRQTWAFNAFTEPTYAAAHLNQLARLVREGFVRRLVRRRAFDQIDHHLDVVAQDVGW